VNVRAAARIAGLVLLFAIIAPVHITTKLLLRRSAWPHRFLTAAGWVMGLRINVRGRRVSRHSLIVANHTSWLDIVILGGSLNSAFVSKDNLGHGFLHWLADQNDTVYVKRAHVKGAKDQAIALAKALERDKPVTVFPEGTTGPGTHLLPFRSTLLEAANYAAKDVSVRPVAVEYGGAIGDIAWFEETGMENVMRVLGRKGTLPITVHALAPLYRTGDRKRLCADARDAIAGTLGFKLHAHSPIARSE
jgi:1-acyl-sn-glycerol-3-phosphate acyltransferase